MFRSLGVVAEGDGLRPGLSDGRTVAGHDGQIAGGERSQPAVRTRSRSLSKKVLVGDRAGLGGCAVEEQLTESIAVLVGYVIATVSRCHGANVSANRVVGRRRRVGSRPWP